MTSNPAQWVKASRSTGSGQCVEMRRQDAAVEVRDSKAAGVGPILRFSPPAFAAWVEGAKSGKFDHMRDV